MSSVKQRRAAYSQNFLHSRRLVSTLVEQSSIGENDVVIEIGPGKGIITEALAARSRHVLTIEKDPHHAALMRQRFADRPNVTVFACDFLASPLPEKPFKVFANIPYRITTAIVAKLTSGVAPPADTYLTVQREAAMKFAGTDGESMLSVSMKPWFVFSIEHEFRRSDFVPRPAVDSVLLRIALRDDPAVAWEGRGRFGQLVEAVFSAWQPTMGQALRTLLPKPAMNEINRNLGRSLGVRPSASTIEQWVALYRVLADVDDERIWAACAAASARLRHQQDQLERPTRTRVHSR
jgi:23S rRNA (adenine-N6)-dimethyltransferase